ncbi:unnamed protein product [Owenia fusiformis]|uniref:Uncharacterized protein n=1 Tax=Owenia fusiformis TaxID=6347 RepID=A0A8J1T7D6_OWEFU|nr:unnamed protein product [Owenia fusiformis]
MSEAEPVVVSEDNGQVADSKPDSQPTEQQTENKPEMNSEEKPKDEDNLSNKQNEDETKEEGMKNIDSQKQTDSPAPSSPKETSPRESVNDNVEPDNTNEMTGGEATDRTENEETIATEKAQGTIENEEIDKMNDGENVNSNTDPVETEAQTLVPTATMEESSHPVLSPEPEQDNVATGTEPTTDTHVVDPHAESPIPPSMSLNDATATVKFVLMPSGQVATLACTLGQTLRELKDHFAAELKMPPQLILLMFDGKNMSDNITLSDLGVGPNGTVQLEMQSADPVNTPIRAIRPKVEYHMPDVITVRVQTDDGTWSDVVVEIERATRKKPYLGGYRHKKTDAIYHHASAQTQQKTTTASNVERFCRDTQTHQQKHEVIQTFEDTSTQMTKIGVYVSNMEDSLIIPGKYTTADEHHAMILTKIIIIQKYYRRWLAKRQVTRLRDDKRKRIEWERREELRKKKEKEDRIKKEFSRRMNPKTKEDFDLLYHALEKWRDEEVEKINAELTGAERKAALCQLLEQETQLIASIGRHKLDAEDENKQKRIQGFLDKAAAPKRWKAFDGGNTEMDTPYTIRAQELKDIYNSINMKYLTQDERLDVLLTLKHTVKEHDCKLTQEIIELIDREADLLMRGVKESNLEGLRKRISTLFLQYIKTPTFNPEAARLLKVPQDPSQLRKNIYFCPSCNKYLPSTEFQLSSNARTTSKCRQCEKVDNDGRLRQDYSHYRHMMKSIQRSEEAHGDSSKICYLLQESDLRYMVENIWSSQSGLSAWEDLYDLVLVRWDIHEEWSPWNCVFLTKEEASAHEKLKNLEEAYDKVFIHKVKHKHVLARNYFARLPGMSEHMRTKTDNRTMSGPSIAGKAVSMQA